MFQIADESFIELFGALRHGYETLQVVAIDTDVQVGEFLQAYQPVDVLLPGHGEVSVKRIALHLRVLIQPSKLGQDIPVREHVAGAWRQIERLVPKLQCLPDAVMEEIVAHHHLGTQFFRVRTEVAIEVADAGCFDMQEVTLGGNEFPAKRAIYLGCSGDF